MRSPSSDESENGDCRFQTAGRAGRDAGRGVIPVAVPLSGLYRVVGRDRGVQHRHLDAERGGGLADDQPRSRPVHRFAGAGGNIASAVPVRSSGRGACRHRRSPPAAHCHPSSDRGAGGGIRRAGLAGTGHPGPASRLHLRGGDGSGARHAGLAVDRSAVGTAATAATGRRSQQYWSQYQPRGRPALAGIIIAAWGIAAPFWVNALSTLGVIAGLVWWRSQRSGDAPRLPPEQFFRAIGTGLRHGRHNPALRATLIRAAGFFIFGSAYWALLPLVARNQVAGGP